MGYATGPRVPLLTVDSRTGAWVKNEPVHKKNRQHGGSKNDLPAPDHEKTDAESGCPDNDRRINRGFW